METDPSACRLSRPLHPIFVSTAPQAHNIQQMRNWDAEAQQHCSKTSPCLPKSHTRIPAASVAVLPWRNYVFFLLAKGPLCYLLAVIHCIFPPTAAVDFYFYMFLHSIALQKQNLRLWLHFMLVPSTTSSPVPDKESSNDDKCCGKQWVWALIPSPH